jgi:uncharacterized protein (TIGR02453 family)
LQISIFTFLHYKQMKNKEILQFLSELNENNNREWYSRNKERCKALQTDYAKTVQTLIEGISLFDPEIKGLEAKNCLFRLFRDTRFSPDKTPYKTHFGAYMAAQGGRKSLRAGYYFHLEPGGSFISGGIYMPEPEVLKALRLAIYENIDEWLEITGGRFVEFFPEMYGEDEKLKKIPLGFPKDWPHGELLKYKHYAFGHGLDDSFFEREDGIDQLLAIFKEIQPVNRFLNFTVDEVLNLG